MKVKNILSPAHINMIIIFHSCLGQFCSNFEKKKTFFSRKPIRPLRIERQRMWCVLEYCW